MRRAASAPTLCSPTSLPHSPPSPWADGLVFETQARLPSPTLTPPPRSPAPDHLSAFDDDGAPPASASSLESVPSPASDEEGGRLSGQLAGLRLRPAPGPAPSRRRRQPAAAGGKKNRASAAAPPLFRALNLQPTAAPRPPATGRVMEAQGPPPDAAAAPVTTTQAPGPDAPLPPPPPPAASQPSPPKEMGLSAAGQAAADRYLERLAALAARRAAAGAATTSTTSSRPPLAEQQVHRQQQDCVRAAPAGATVTLAAAAASSKAAAAAVADAAKAAAATAGATGTQVAAAAAAAAAAVCEAAATTPPRPPAHALLPPLPPPSAGRPPRPPVAPAASAFATPQKMWRPPPVVPRRTEAGPPLPTSADASVAIFKAQADAADWADAANRKLVVGSGGGGTAGPSSIPASPGPAQAEPTAPDEPVKLWCEEVPNELGRSFRHFLAASFGALWKRSRFGCVGLAPGRHIYEVLREGRPAHLYFDLEFVPGANPGVDGDAVVDALVRLVAADLKARWGMDLDPSTHVLEADSSTPDKWSRHLTIRLPGGAAFKDGQAAGRYVAELLGHAGADALRVRAKNSGGGGGEAAASSDWTWAVDTAVYTRNRHFRTLLSSKFGKAAPLMPTPRFVCGPGGPGEAARPGGPGGGAPAPPSAWSLRDLWLFSLASAVEPGSRLVDVAPRDPWVDSGFLGQGGGSAARAAAPAAGWGLEEACAMLERGPGAGGLAASPAASPARPFAGASSPSRAALPPGVAPRYGLGYKYDPRDVAPGGPPGPPAPDPGLVALVQATTPLVEAAAAARAGGRPAYVRRATVCGRRGHVVTFTLVGPGSHWCGRKGGHHASNNIYFLVNYAAGAAAQKCHDPDCAGYASEAVPLPDGLARQAARVFGVSASGAGLSLDQGV